MLQYTYGKQHSLETAAFGAMYSPTSSKASPLYTMHSPSAHQGLYQRTEDLANDQITSNDASGGVVFNRDFNNEGKPHSFGKFTPLPNP